MLCVGIHIALYKHHSLHGEIQNESEWNASNVARASACACIVEIFVKIYERVRNSSERCDCANAARASACVFILRNALNECKLDLHPKGRASLGSRCDCENEAQAKARATVAGILTASVRTGGGVLQPLRRAGGCAAYRRRPSDMRE